MKAKLIGIALLAFVLLLPAAAGATLILFDDYRDDGPGITGFHEIDYIGSYTTNGSFMTSYSVAFGDCDGCWYDRPVGIGSFPDGIGPFHEIVMAHNGRNEQLNYYPKSRTFDSFLGAWGAYCVVGVDLGCNAPRTAAEPAAFWLMAGALIVATAYRARR